EIRKLQRYAEKALEAGQDEDARRFLEKKAALADKVNPLQTAYDLASSNAASMKQMQEKLTSDLSELEARRTSIKMKMAATKVQQRKNSMGSPVGDSKDSVFGKLEEKVNLEYD